jgi:hypothetical protein
VVDERSNRAAPLNPVESLCGGIIGSALRVLYFEEVWASCKEFQRRAPSIRVKTSNFIIETFERGNWGRLSSQRAQCAHRQIKFSF